MPQEYAKAYPRKRFFLEMFTRDISLEECILDLIDNSIDGALRHLQIKTDDLLQDSPDVVDGESELPTIIVSFNANEFQIIDECGGITVEDAKEDTFNFGHAASKYDDATGTLGAYGIGLKRAIFKMGNHFRMESRTADEGFIVDVDLKEWAVNDDNEDDWRFPMELIGGAQADNPAGTKITITELSEDARSSLSDEDLEIGLRRKISRTYALFLDRYIKLEVNGKRVGAIDIPIGFSNEVEPCIEKFSDDDVDVTIIASLAARNEAGNWAEQGAGWYIACNGRLVVIANKTELTGWIGKGGIMPIFQPQYRGFVGVVFFQSENPLKLPWTTTKRSLNRDAAIYRRTKNRMEVAAAPVIRTLQKLYRKDTEETADEREAASKMEAGDIKVYIQRSPRKFNVAKPDVPEAETTTQINFTVQVAEIDRVTAHIGRRMSKARLGRFVFDYYLKSEGLANGNRE